MFLRPIGWLLVCGGGLVVLAGLVYWAMGWRYDGAIAIMAAAWGLPFIAIGTALGWMDRRPAGAVAIVSGLAAIWLLTVDGFVLWSWLLAATAAVAVLLGIAILVINRRPVT